MPFTPKQLRKIHATRRKVPHLADDGVWRFVLRMTGCRRDPKTREPSLSHPGNGHAEYETIMHRLSLYPEAELDEAHWAMMLNQKGGRLRHALVEFSRACMAAGLCSMEALPAMCERMTAHRPEYADQPPTADVRKLDTAELMHVAEGFKAWMRREAKKRGVQAPKFGGAA